MVDRIQDWQGELSGMVGQADHWQMGLHVSPLANETTRKSFVQEKQQRIVLNHRGSYILLLHDHTILQR